MPWSPPENSLICCRTKSLPYLTKSGRGVIRTSDKGRSCESQLILTTYDLAKGLDDKSQIDAILLDFSKAFDKVSHRRLLQKLNYYGVRGEMSAWISAFLSGRSAGSM